MKAEIENLKGCTDLKRIYRKIAAATVLCLLFAASSVQGDAIERIEVGSSFNPVGSGARALGMGGAFIGIADDATAASWNPGGLSQLDAPELSVVYGYTHRIEDTEIEHEAVGAESFSPSHLNYLSFAYPLTLGKNMTVSLNYQKMYDFYHGWSYILNKNVSERQLTDYEQKGSLYALGLAYCVDLSMNFALGFTLNYWGDFIFKNQWEQKRYQEWDTKLENETVFKVTDTLIGTEEYNFEGWNANIGFLWKICQKLRLGGVFKMPFTADIERKAMNLLTINNKNQQICRLLSNTYNEKLRMPMSYGIGLAYRCSDTLTFAADIYRTQWDEFELEDEKGNKISPISGKPIADVKSIHDTTWFRIGLEKVIIVRKWNLYFSLRGGIFYDPAPSEGKSDEYYGASGGVGIVWNSLVLDFAYQFRYGNNVNTAMSDGLSQDIDEHTAYTSLIVYF